MIPFDPRLGRRFLPVLLFPVLLIAQSLPGAVVITEIHYDHAANSVPAEYVELYNTGEAPVDLSGWEFTDGVFYTFSDGAEIAAGGYLVIAENPTVARGQWQLDTVLGPYEGSLNSDGETLTLRDSAGNLVDEVDWKVGFPWPISSSGDGGSMQLLNPALDNNLGSSWRAVQESFDNAPTEATLVAHWPFDSIFGPGVAAQGEDLRVIGDGEGTSDSVAGNAFDLRGSDTRLQLGIFGGLPAGLPLGDESYTVALFFKTDTRQQGGIVGWGQFASDGGANALVVGDEAGADLASLGGGGSTDLEASMPDYADNEWHLLGVTYDAASSTKKLYFDGQEIASRSVDDMDVQGMNFFVGYVDGNYFEGLIDELRVYRGVLKPKDFENMMASPGDFIINAGVGKGTLVTPGAINSVHTGNAPPNIRQVGSVPEQPAGGQPAVLTAKVTDPDGVASVTLSYQVVSPGNYIPAYLPIPVSSLVSNPYQEQQPNPAFENPANWTEVEMRDDGTNGDALAGDFIYSVTLPAQEHRTLVRYRVTVADDLGESIRVPYADDASLNFAYYVYDGVPDYHASRSVNGGSRTYTAEELTTIPVYHLVTRNEDLRECLAYNSSQQMPHSENVDHQEARRYYNWEGAMVYDGKVYDHIRYRLRGANGRYYLSGKRSMKFNFHKGSYFEARDQNGEVYPQKFNIFNVSKMFGNRLYHNFGLLDSINGQLWREVGVPAQKTHFFHFRVVDDEDEAPDQWRGDFWGYYLFQERYDVGFIEARDMPKGNLYKMSDFVFEGGRQLRYQGADSVSDASDYENIRWNLNAEASESWIREHVNLDLWYRYSAVTEAIRHHDVFNEPIGRHTMKNMVWFFEPSAENLYGRLWLLPYDADASWGPNYENPGDHVENSIYRRTGGGSPKPSLQIEHKNVLRSFQQLVWQPEFINPMLENLASTIDVISEADRERWVNAPSSEGSFNNFGTVWDKVENMKQFAFSGGNWSGGSVPNGGSATFLSSLSSDSQIPATPTISYSGEAGFPVDSLSFETTPFASGAGHGFSAVEWRVAEVSDPEEVLVSAGAVWKYLDDGSDQGTAWRGLGFADATWLAGEAPLGYGENDEATVVSYGGNPDEKHITTYFRKRFEVEDLDQVAGLRLRFRRDDGIAIFLNGEKVGEDNLPWIYDYDDTATSAVSGGDELAWLESTVPTSALVEGGNVLAVEVHQASADSSDLTFDLELIAEMKSDREVRSEWNADWETRITANSTTVDVSPGALRSGSAYRARVRYIDQTNRASFWSEPLEFVAGSPLALTRLADDLRITEIMYNPADETVEERLAGFDRSDFEFVEIYNAGAEPLDLAEVRLTKGVDFDFRLGPTTLEPGAHGLVVKDMAAFEMRYGTGLPVLGVFERNLANDGERLKISYGAGNPIIDFDYSDDAPWPMEADGDGHSLVLLDPAGAAVASPQNWRPSTYVGGSPGVSDPEAGVGIEGWRASHFEAKDLSRPEVSGNEADPDGDGLSNLIEYGFGSDPVDSTSAGLPRMAYIEEAGELYLSLEMTRPEGLSDVGYAVEASPDLVEWEVVELPMHGAPVSNSDGTETVVLRDAVPLDEAGETRYLRVRVSQQ